MLWIRNDKTGELYESKNAAAEALGISRSYVSKLLSGRMHSLFYRISRYDDDKPENTHRKRKPSYYHPKTVQTKCCDCDNYHCSWIQRFEPVPGWDAVEEPKNQSYIVRECPEFKENERRKK